MELNSTYKYQIGGSLSIDAPSYVDRKADKELYNWLKEREFCYVLNSRQMGKSSLRVRTMHRLEKEGFACASIDITLLGSHQVTPDEWYGGFVDCLQRSFRLKVNLTNWWRERSHIAPLQRLSEFIEDILLAEISQNIVIFVDEIDSILRVNFAIDDFFAFIKYCYEERASNREYQRLTFALFGVATPYDLIQAKIRSPFNIAKPIELEGFSIEELDKAKHLVIGFANNFAYPKNALAAVLDWTGGQPFLTQKICKILQSLEYKDDKISQGRETEVIDKLVKTRIIDNWEAQDEPPHLKTIRDRILRSPQRTISLLGLYQEILQKGEIPFDDSPEQAELRLSGLVVKQEGKLKVYNRIYQEIFNQDWVDGQLSNLRPYANKLAAWLASECQDESKLLRGKELQNALSWTEGKKLIEQDYRFLSASQTWDKTTLAGRYAIIKKLGESGFGETYVAKDTDIFGLYCVIKKQRFTSSNPYYIDNVKTRFFREAEILDKLGTHPQIPTLLAYFEEKEELYLVYEFIDGNDLRQEFERKGRLSEAEVIQILEDVLEVLSFIHQYGVLHQDIKPSNLIRRKSDGKIILIDFLASNGSSFYTDKSERAINSTLILGTPGYMPIEQIHGKPNFRSDIYALGMTVIEGLTGISPDRLQDITTLEVIWRHHVSINPRLANILDKMVRYDWRERYQSALKVLEDLRELKTPKNFILCCTPPPPPPPPSSIWPSQSSSLTTRKILRHKPIMCIIIGGFIGASAVIGFIFINRLFKPNLNTVSPTVYPTPSSFPANPNPHLKDKDNIFMRRGLMGINKSISGELIEPSSKDYAHTNGKWKLHFSNGLNSYEGLLSMKGRQGKLIIKFFDTNENRTKTIEQTMTLWTSARGLVLLGVNPVDTDTKKMVSNYSPDNFIITLLPDGNLSFITCDNGNICSPVKAEFLGKGAN